MTTQVITAQGWNVIKPGCLGHFRGDVTAKVCDLLSNVTEESIAGLPAQEHDGVNRDMVKIHGHGSRGPAGVQTDGVRRDFKALVFSGFYVGPEELERNGTGHIPEFSRGQQVGVDESFGGCLEGLETTYNGSGGFDRAKERMVCG